MTPRLTHALAAFAIWLAPFAVQAADMPYLKAPLRENVEYYTWSGVYAGLTLGYGWGTSDWDASGFRVDPKGLLYGVTLGANWQAGFVVYGLEGDFSLTDMKQSGDCAGLACETKNSWLGTARARLGVSMGALLPYITGGLAVGDIKATLPGFAGGNATAYGWTIGGGLEAALRGALTAKLEYLYVDLGRFDCGLGCGLVTPNDVHLTANIVRFGLNYKFSGPMQPNRW
jgi:outer membrane immunogenic protein